MPQRHTLILIGLLPMSIFGQQLSPSDGLHASLDLSAFATLGGHAPHHGGFSQALSVDYTAPLSLRLKLTAGAYLSNTLYGGDDYRDAGLYAQLSYQLSPRWEVFAYGQLSAAKSNGGWASYGPAAYGYGWPMGYGGWLPTAGMVHTTAGTPLYPGVNMVGVGARYAVSPSFSIGVSVHGVWANGSRMPEIADKYKYPVPE